MVIAINTDRSSKFSVTSEVHFKASLREPGVSVGFFILRNTCFRCFLSFIHLFFLPVTFFTLTPLNCLCDSRPLGAASLLLIVRFSIQEHAPWCSCDQDL